MNKPQIPGRPHQEFCLVLIPGHPLLLCSALFWPFNSCQKKQKFGPACLTDLPLLGFLAPSKFPLRLLHARRRSTLLRPPHPGRFFIFIFKFGFPPRYTFAFRLLHPTHQLFRESRARRHEFSGNGGRTANGGKVLICHQLHCSESAAISSSSGSQGIAHALPFQSTWDTRSVFS